MQCKMSAGVDSHFRAPNSLQAQLSVDSLLDTGLTTVPTSQIMKLPRLQPLQRVESNPRLHWL